MKILKRCIIIFVTCILNFQLMGMAYLDAENYSVKSIEEIISIEEVDVEFCQRQTESIEQYQSMLLSFNDAAGARSSNEQSYDSNYGGAYINSNGDLVVLLVDCSSAEIDEIKVATVNDAILIEQCEYSFNELILVINTINQNLNYLSNHGIIISEMHEDVCSNKVYIGIYNYTEEKETIIRDLIDHPCMEIYEQNNIIKEDINIRGGYGIVGGVGTSTIGFCATKGNTYGFVIAGHAVANLYDNFTYSGTTVGYATASARYNNTTADAAFLTKASNVTTTSYIDVYTCHYLGTSISDFPSQALIYKYGATTNLTSGRIQSNYVTVYVGGVGETDEGFYALQQTTATYTSQGGDSGGPVFMIKDTVNGNVRCLLLGIHSGSNNEVSSFSKYYNIVNELGISAITD